MIKRAARRVALWVALRRISAAMKSPVAIGRDRCATVQCARARDRADLNYNRKWDGERIIAAHVASRLQCRQAGAPSRPLLKPTARVRSITRLQLESAFRLQLRLARCTARRRSNRIQLINAPRIRIFYVTFTHIIYKFHSPSCRKYKDVVFNLTRKYDSFSVQSVQSSYIN